MREREREGDEGRKRYSEIVRQSNDKEGGRK
jgi:hypothetical protein